jgi:Tfp pilus assembly protein PilO
MNNNFIPVGAIAIAIAIIFLYVSPTYNGSIASSKNAIANTERALLAADEYKLREKTLLDEKAGILPEDLERLTNMFPSSVDNISLTIDLSALAVRSGVLLTNIAIEAPDKQAQASEGSPVGFVDLSLSATGSYGAFRTFLTSLEKSLRLLDVRSLSVESSDTGVYKYDLIIRLYWLR